MYHVTILKKEGNHMADIAKMEAVFNEVADRYYSAEHTRNAVVGGLYIQNEGAIKQMVKGLKDRFATAKNANDVDGMKAVFQEALEKFEAADHMRNFHVSRMYHEAEVATKQIVKMLQAEFDAAVAG
jgi:hypothetical protein